MEKEDTISVQWKQEDLETSYSLVNNNNNNILSVFFPLQNAVFFIILTHLVPVLFTFYIQDVLKIKKNNNSCAKS